MAKLYIVDKYPAEYASGVYINDLVWAQFSVPISSSTATYYNFTVNEKNTYEPVEGTVTVQGVSGGLLDSVIVFTPTNGFTRNTEYSVLVSTGIKAKNSDDYLEDDTVWFFKTGNTALSGLLGGDYDILSSGVTSSGVVESSELSTSGIPLEVLETVPANYSINNLNNIPFIGIRFNGVIPSGINMADHISLSARRVLG